MTFNKLSRKKTVKKLKNNSSLSNYIIFAIIVLLSSYLIYTLVLTPVIGKADNGDFGRMYNSLGIGPLGNSYHEIYTGYFQQTWKISSPGFFIPWCNDWVFGCWLLKIPSLFALMFGVKYFDIRAVGIFYSLIFLLGVYLILKYSKINSLGKLFGGIFILIFFTDSSYISYFNSFFGEATTISFLFLFIGSILNLIDKDNPKKLDLLFLFFASFGFLTSKTQQLPLLIFMILIYIALYKFYPTYRKLILSSSLIVITMCIITFFSIGTYTNRNNIYQAVFTGVLKGSETPKEDLIDLGLDPKFAPLANSGFYDKGLAFDPLGDEMMKDFYPNIGLSKILKFYAKHPNRAFEKFIASAENAYDFHKSSERDFNKGEYTTNKLINNFRVSLINKYPGIHRNFTVFFTFSLIYLLVLIYHFFKFKNREYKILTLTLLFLLAAGASQLVLPVIGSGEADFGKHLFLINLAYDSLLCSCLIFLGVKAQNLFSKIYHNKKISN